MTSTDLGVGPFAAAMRLIDQAKDAGFRFERIGTGEDAPLQGKRHGLNYVDEVYLNGYRRDCTAIRRKLYGLVMPGGLPVTDRINGDAVTVLLRVLDGWQDE